MEKFDIIINNLENIKVNQDKFEKQVNDKFKLIEVNTSKIPVIETKVSALEESVKEIKADVKNIRDNHLFHMSESIGKLEGGSKWSKLLFGGVGISIILAAVRFILYGG